MAENQPSQNQFSALEWTEEAKPFTVCMACDTEFSETEAVCPKCKLKLLVVHRCPRCSRVAAVKHLRCPYCAWRFVKGEALEAALERASSAVNVEEDSRNETARKRKQKNVLFALGMLAVVFGGAAFLLRHKWTGSPIAVLGSSYGLRSVNVRHAPSERALFAGKLASGVVVPITSVQRDDQGKDWYQIRYSEGLEFVRVNDLAPPKGADAEGGYQLLKVSLADLNDPSEAADAAKAVELFRRQYPGDPRGLELLWLLAGKTHEMGGRTRSRDALSVSGKAYQELAALKGHYAAGAEDALKRLPDAPAEGNSTAPAPTGIEVIGANTVGPAESKSTLPHKMMLLNQTMVLVNLPQMSQLQEGQIFLAHVASDVITNHEVAVPGGSSCRVKITAIHATTKKSWVGLQLQSVQVGEYIYPVDAVAIQLPLSDLQLKPGPGSPVLFHLRRSLILSR